MTVMDWECFCARLADDYFSGETTPTAEQVSKLIDGTTVDEIKELRETLV
jgi:hypothetical protein